MKKLYRIAFIALLLLSNLSLWAQKADDYRAAANKGDKVAQFMLGSCYYVGSGVAQDYKQAVYWYTKAADQGLADAQYALGVCYKNGDGVSQDYKQAVYWFTKSANQGYAAAQFNLGRSYEDGNGVAQDYKQAVYWYTKAANQGFAVAQSNLGVCYKNGNGVAQDYKQAVYWYTKAANQGLAVAQFNLGRSYEDGKGVTKDESQAVFWYCKAAEQGQAEAQFQLAGCYWIGKGVEKDLNLSKSWYVKAINNPELGEDDKTRGAFILYCIEEELLENGISTTNQSTQNTSLSDKPTNKTNTSSTNTSSYKSKYFRWPYYYSNPIYGFRFGYVQRSLRVSGYDLDEPVHIDMFGEENDIIPGFQLGFLFDPSDWLNMGMFGLNMGVNFEMFFNKWDAAPSNHYDKYMEMNLNFPLDLTFHIPFSSESALYLHGGLAIDWGIYNRLTYSRNSNIEPLTDVFCKHWIDNLNLSYEYGVDLRMKAVMLSLNYQKGFYGHPVFENYSTTIDKLSLGLSFVF